MQQMVNWNLSAEIAPLCFFDHFHLISITYAITQNPICNFVTSCPHIIHTKFHQKLMKTEEEEQNF